MILDISGLQSQFRALNCCVCRRLPLNDPKCHFQNCHLAIFSTVLPQACNRMQDNSTLSMFNSEVYIHSMIFHWSCTCLDSPKKQCETMVPLQVPVVLIRSIRSSCSSSDSPRLRNAPHLGAHTLRELGTVIVLTLPSQPSADFGGGQRGDNDKIQRRKFLQLVPSTCAIFKVSCCKSVI